jgi:4-phytase/acid phosphatase
MKNNFRAAVLLFAALLGISAEAQTPQLKYVVIVSRHGVRSPTWENARLNEYSAEPWPDWGVPPGYLTPYGRVLMKLMGAYYHDLLSEEHLIDRQGCRSVGQIFIWADTTERTLETGKAMAESLLPGCGLPVHSRSDRTSDPIFSGFGARNPELELKAIRDRLNANPGQVSGLRSAVDSLQFLLTDGSNSPKKLTDAPLEIGLSVQKRSVEVTGPVATGSTLGEDFLLEYANNFEGKDLAWGRLNEENLSRIMELHAAYADLARRTPYVARARGSDLLWHILRSLEQAATSRSVHGALDQPGNKVLLLIGHDTNLANISGMLNLSWHLTGYQPDDTPPGGALVFSLWLDPSSGQSYVRSQYVSQTLDQMRRALSLTASTPPAQQDVVVPGCPAASEFHGCPWPSFDSTLKQAIDPSFVSTGDLDDADR